MTDDIPLTKRAIETTGRQYAERLLDRGERSPLVALIRLRAWRDVLDEAIDGLKEEAMAEAERYGPDDRAWRGVGFRVRNGRTYYDYSHDPKWVELKAAEKATAAARKGREQFLRGLDEAIVVRDTGEIVRPAKVAKVGRAVLAIHFPKE
jgi:hypothetical protein